jgi:hypothetical protein
VSALVILYAIETLATLTLLLPLWQARQRWATLSTAQKLFTAYIGFEVLIEVISFTIGRFGKTNIWVPHLGVPVETMIIVFAFGAWQVDHATRVFLQRMAPAMLLFWLPPLVGWVPLNANGVGTEWIQAILCLAIAAYTMVRRFFEDSGPAVEHAWFWIGAGVMLYYATFALMMPLVGYFVRISPDTAVAMLTVNGGLQVFVNILFYHGMQCPISQGNYGSSSLQPRVWLPFSSSRSRLP